MNIVSHLAAADCASGVVGNMEISKHTWTIIYHQQDPDNMNSIASFSTTARYFKKILHHIIGENISFHMNPVMRLTFAVFAFGSHINFFITKPSDTVIARNNQQIRL